MGPNPLSFSIYRPEQISSNTRRTLMTNLFSRDLLLRKPRLSHLQMPQLPTTLQVIPEEDEPCTPATPSRSSPTLIRPEKRTFSSSHIEVSFGDDEDEHDLLSSPRPAPRPPLTPPRCNSYDVRSGATSPTPSTSSLSSDPPSTPTSDDELSTSYFMPQRASINPLGITNTYTKTASFSSQEEASDGDESDSEWYTREFSKIISLKSPLSPWLTPRPESLLIEPTMTEELFRVTESQILVEPRYQPLKRATAISHKRSRSVPKETPPPVPPIPAQFLSSADLQSAQASSTPAVSAKPRPRSLSLRRPPPRTSIPDDCLTEDVVTGADESSWPSAFDISSYEHPSPAPSPAFICPSPSSARAINRSTALSVVPEVPASPVSMYSQTSQPESEDFDAFEGFGEIEFALDDVKFDLSIDLPMRLPLSLPNSPIDLETDFALGLEELRKTQEAESTTLALPIIAISDADEASGQQEEELSFPALNSPPLPSTPSTATSFDSYYASGDAEAVETTSLAEEEGVESPTGPVLSSRWSSSTLASIREEHASRSSKFPAASKLRLYFGGGSSPLSKYRQNQRHQEQKQQHKRSGSAAAIAAAKAAVARAATGAIYHSSSYPHPPPTSSTSIGTPTAVKKAQRQVVVVQPPPSPSFYSYYPRTPTTPAKPSTPSTPSTPLSPPGSPFPQGKRKAAWSRRESDVMVIGYGYGGVGKELRRKGSLTPTVSDAGSEESRSSCSSNGLRRKPIPVEMFLRNTNV